MKERAAQAVLQEHVPLAPLTTLQLGGPARYFLEAATASQVREAIAIARRRSLGLAVLGGGSNLVVADQGFDGLVLRMVGKGLRSEPGPEGTVRVIVEAGETWDTVVGWAVGQGLAGIECLSGVPGTAGATPIQNVGAYGQEISDVLESVRVLDLDDHGLREHLLGADACAFGYRTSRFREHPGRFLVLELSLLLRPGGPPRLRYPELVRAVEEDAGSGQPVDLARVRRIVLELRRGKSMLIEPSNPGCRSVGSFFVNPVLDQPALRCLEERALERGLVSSGKEVPRFDAGQGRFKVPAAWLIQASGFRRGERRGAVGISRSHVLALVHHGGGSSRELLDLAREVRDRVARDLGVELRPEPVLLGFGDDPLA